MSDPREAKLPGWVQQELTSLRCLLERAERRAEEARLATAASDSDTILKPFDNVPIGLGRGETVRFLLEPEQQFSRSGYIDVRTEGNRIRVVGADQILVRPSSGNAISVKLGRG